MTTEMIEIIKLAVIFHYLLNYGFVGLCKEIFIIRTLSALQLDRMPL